MEAADVIFKAISHICPSVGVEWIQTCSAIPSTTDVSAILNKLKDIERETKSYRERNCDAISELRGDLRTVNDRMNAALCNSVYRDDNQCLSTNNVRRRRKCFGYGSIRHLVRECPKRIRNLDISTHSNCKGRRASTPMNNLTEETAIKLENVVVTGHEESADLHRFVTIVFRDKPVCALVDTGASVSLIKKSLWDGLSSAEKGPLSASPKGTRFVGAGGSDLSILGEIEVPLLTQPIIPKRNEVFITDSEVVPASSEIRVLAKLTNHVGGDDFSPSPVFVERDVEFNAIQDSTGVSPHPHEMDALRDRLLLADQVTDEVLGEQRAKMKRHHDKQCHGKEISVGDRVLLNNPAVPVDRCRKFHSLCKGPYKVVRKVGQVNYQVEDDHGKKQTVHYNRLKRVSKDVNRLEEAVESHEGNNAPVRDESSPMKRHVRGPRSKLQGSRSAPISKIRTMDVVPNVGNESINDRPKRTRRPIRFYPDHDQSV
ncbi:unnamed protein product [Clavelina lepadiformis]|uniref:Peptidase A2 domain-containing protein n=1 Tax=Clavelina lepadiformis TaxID=159417 RepID=A0ABP0FVE7_CLALP